MQKTASTKKVLKKKKSHRIAVQTGEQKLTFATMNQYGCT